MPLPPSRRSSSVRVFCALLAVLTILTACAAADAQKPIEEVLFFADGPSPPSSAPDMVEQSDAVVVAEHTGQTRAVKTALAAGLSAQSTVHVMRLKETVKFHPLLPAMDGTFELSVSGGDEEFSTFIRRNRPMDTVPINQAGTYVVFLRLNPNSNALWLNWSYAGLFQVTSGIVQAVDVSQTPHVGKSKTAFLAELYAAVNN